jgi:hypothetical protein
MPAPYRLLLLSALSCLVLFEIALAQKIDRKRPGVYITFKEFVKKTAAEVNPMEGARLVLHNNTRWPIYYGTWYEPVLPGDVAMIYNIQMAENGCYDIRMHVDVVNRGNKLLPGKTVSFTVPRGDFPKGSNIFLLFEYAWELDQDNRFPGEADHRAYFISGHLPQWPQE